MKKGKLMLPIIGLISAGAVAPCIVSCSQQTNSNTLDPLVRADAYAQISNEMSLAIIHQPEATKSIRAAAELLYGCLDKATITEQCIAIKYIGVGTEKLDPDDGSVECGIIYGIAKQPEAEGKLMNFAKVSTNIIMSLTAPDKIYAIGVGSANAMYSIAVQPEAEHAIFVHWLLMVEHILGK